MQKLDKARLAVIFDLDGTLLDTIRDYADSMNAALMALGFPVHEVDIYRGYIGGGVKKSAERALPEYARNSGNIDKCVDIMKTEYEKRWRINTKPYPGILKLLKQLESLKIKLSIVSNKDDELTKAMVDLLLPPCFVAVKGLVSGILKKPDPTHAKLCADLMGAEYNRCVFIGDSSIDVETAINAGMTPFVVLWGYQREGHPFVSNEHKFSTPRELLDFFIKER